MESHDALVRDALDACPEPALALDAHGSVLAVNAALLSRLGMPHAAAFDNWRVDGLSRRRRAAAEVGLRIGDKATRRFLAADTRRIGRGSAVVVLRETERPAPAAVLLERQLDLREHVGESPDDFFREATETLAESLAVARAAIWLFDDRRADLVCADCYDRRDRRHDAGERFSAAENDAYFRAVAERRVIVADDVLSDPATRALVDRRLAALGIGALVDVAIRSGGEPRGMLCIGHVGGPRAWRPEDVKFALGVASQAMIAIGEHERRLADGALRDLAASLERRVVERTAALAAAERQSRELLATLDATSDGAFVFDPRTLRFSYANAGALRQSGFTREELLTMTPLDLAQDIDEGSFRRLLDELRHGERGAALLSAVHRRRDGGSLPVEVNLQLVAPDDGEPRFVAIARDIGDRVRTERIARRAERLQSLGTLAGGVAHDLNNALTPALVAAEELRAGEPASAATLELLEQSVQRAIGMVRNLLAFAKGQEGRSEPLCPQRLVEEIVRVARATFPPRVAVDCALADDAPQVLGEATQLHQVLLNLAVNARDAMPNGGDLSVTVVANPTDKGDGIRVSVRDTGRGMSPEVLSRIWEPFFTTKPVGEGSGMGLAIVHGVVHQVGGEITVESTVGKGTTFHVILPPVAAAA